MMCVRLMLLAMIFSLASGSVLAETLSGKTLRKEVTGKTVYLSVAAGVELPIRYRRGGVMFGKMKGLVALLPTGMPAKDKGRWWISRNRLCQAWKQWLKKKKYCYTLTRVDGTLYWRRSDGRRGTLRVAEN